MPDSYNNPLKGLWNTFVRSLTFEETPSESVPESPIDQIRERYRETFDGIGEMPDIKVESDVVSTKKFFLEYMTRIGERFRLAGEVDGTVEQKNYAIMDIIKTRVLQIQAYLESTFRGEYDRADGDVINKQQIFENANVEYDSQKQYASELKDRYRRNYKEFSRSMGWIYLIAAILLVAADYPLALKLTRDGFQLVEWWATPLMSVGLALCTLYIKIYYDEFVGSAVEHSVTRFTGLAGIGERSDISKVKRSWWGKSLIKTLILGLSLGTIITLGFFRFQVYEPVLKAAVSDPSDYSNYVNSLTKAAFIMITLLFPLIGGVCASLGFDRLQNNREDRTIDEKSKKKEETKLRASNDLEDAKKRRRVCLSYLKWCGKNVDDLVNGNFDDTNSDFVDDYTLYFLSCYTHGYERGMTLNNLEKDTFTKADEFRKRIIAQKTTKITQTITPEDFYENLKGLAKPAV
jgi:hypothetical protein